LLPTIVNIRKIYPLQADLELDDLMRVLIATGDVIAAASIGKALAKANLIWDATDLSRDALQMAEAYDYEIILLDLTCPDVEGYEVLRRLRAQPVRTPILILSDRADPDYKIKGLGFGADDFLPKPFDAGELAARIRAIVRRSKGHSERVIRTGKFVVNLDTRVATVDDRPVHLTGKEYGILELLSLRKGTTLTKEMFLNHLYGGTDEPELKIIDVFVCKLRKKLAQATGGHHYIQTVWGRGHVLRDPAPVPAAAPVVTLEGLGARHDEAGTRAAEERHRSAS
jgi:two-component system cell cycle response regulator CtrA